MVCCEQPLKCAKLDPESRFAVAFSATLREPFKDR
jgi:hypothetical protein